MNIEEHVPVLVLPTLMILDFYKISESQLALENLVVVVLALFGLASCSIVRAYLLIRNQHKNTGATRAAAKHRGSCLIKQLSLYHRDV